MLTVSPIWDPKLPSWKRAVASVAAYTKAAEVSTRILGKYHAGRGEEYGKVDEAPCAHPNILVLARQPTQRPAIYGFLKGVEAQPCACSW